MIDAEAPVFLDRSISRPEDAPRFPDRRFARAPMKTLSAVILLAAASILPAQGNILAVAWTGAGSLIDSTTGVSTPLGATGAGGLNSLAYNPANGLFYTVGGLATSTNASTLYTVNPTSGAASSTGVVLTVSDVRGLAFTPAGICYAIVNATPDQLHTVNIQTGQTTLVGATGSSSLQALASNASGQLYAWAVSPTATGAGSLFSVNPGTGATTLIGNAFAQIQGLAFSPTGVLYGATQSLYTINTTNGAVTQVGAGGLGDIRGIEFVNQSPPSVTFVPSSGNVSPGGTLVVQYSAPGHGGEQFIPIPSGTLGSFFAPPLPQPLGIAWDVVTDFYFNDPIALAVLPLSGQPGSYVGTLDPAGTSTGLVLPPASFPPGQNIPVHLTFISISATFAITVHGVGTFHLN
jgi:hypothetical protein